MHEKRSAHFRWTKTGTAPSKEKELEFREGGVFANDRTAVRRLLRRRALILVVLVLAAVGAWATWKVKRIERAIARVTEEGGRVDVVRSPSFEGSALVRCYSLLIGDSKMTVTLVVAMSATPSWIACAGSIRSPGSV